MDLPADDGLCEPRRVRVYRGDDQIGGLLALLVPAPAGTEVVTEMLAEQAGDVLPFWSQGRIQCGWDQHFDDRSLGPAVHCCVEIGPVHVVEAGRNDDSGGQMIALLREHGELWKLGQCDIHPESRAL